MDMGETQMVAESFKDIADMMKVNNTVNELLIQASQINDVECDGGLTTDEKIQNLCPGLAVNKGIENLMLYWSLDGSITEKGAGYLERILRTNVYLKNVIIYWGNDIPYGPGTIQNKMIHWLDLNKCNRKLLKDPNVTPTQWRDAIILSSEYRNPDAIFMFLTNKPEWCMM
jgi:hypothetical protein